jgi:AraC-like DNA-binding protein
MRSDLASVLNDYIDAHGGGEGLICTQLDGLVVMRTSGNALPSHTIYRPCLCAVVQGAKQVTFGDKVLDYEEQQCLIVSIDLPVVGRVTQASVEKPYLAIALEFDVLMMRTVMEELGSPPRPSDGVGPGLFVDDMVPALSDCLVRLLRLLDTPQAAPILYPTIMREICFWLLTGRNGSEVCKLALPDSHTRRIANAIYLLRAKFTRAIRVQELAAAARMSPSSFHQHFKALTSMTPLQYQKQLRLLEARRLILGGGVSVSGAAYQVGYESASQFSREYSRMFGVAPRTGVAGSARRVAGAGAVAEALTAANAPGAARESGAVVESRAAGESGAAAV